ncbi:MAG: hypothetical protein CML89_06160 [Rhodobiaceae bacterium]|nr:hypothetical protein [Rhodobiaceae bacterium]
MGNVMKKTLIGFCVSIFYIGFVFGEIPTKPLLTLETAKIMANECLNLAKDNGWKINIAIFESPGALKYYASMDGTYPASEEISRLKGKTSAGLPFSTKELAQMAFDNEDKNEGIVTIPDIALLPGGAPIILRNGYHLGGVGVSGSSGSNDEECAFKAIEKGLEVIYD